MKFGEMRDTVRDRMYVNDTVFTNARVDRAFRAAAQELVRQAPMILRAKSTVTLTAENSAVDLSAVTDLEPESIWRVDLGYDDKSGWVTATGYTLRQSVTNDSKRYSCSTAHTSAAATEPGTGADWETKWQQIYTLIGDKVTVEPIQDVARRLKAEHDSGEPLYLGVENRDNAHAYPVPDVAYKLNIYYDAPLQTWEAGVGSVSGEDIGIPDRYMEGLIEATAAVLDNHYPEDLHAQTMRWFRKEFIPQVKAAPNRGQSVSMKQSRPWA